MKRLTIGCAALVLMATADIAQAQNGHLLVTLPAVEFEGGVLNAADGWSRYCERFCPITADARLPHGARVVGIEIDACRDEATDAPLSLMLVRVLPNGNEIGGDRFQVLIQDDLDQVGCGYHAKLADVPITVDQFSTEILVVVLVGSTPFCGSTGQPVCPDEGTRFQAVRVFYEPNADGGVVEPSKRSDFSPF